MGLVKSALTPLTRIAKETRLVAGGGVALLRARAALENLHTGNADQDAGVQIVLRAIESPLRQIVANLQDAKAKFGDNLWVAPSCSLLHSPQDLALEEKLDAEIKSWMAFAAQKLVELGNIKQALQNGLDSIQAVLAASDAAQADRMIVLRDGRIEAIHTRTEAPTEEHVG